MTPAGKLTSTPLCTRVGCPNGALPYTGLTLATDGNLYGTAYSGGANGAGTIFKVAPSGSLTLLHSFDVKDGAGPQSGLMQATNGKFYGTVAEGGKSKCTTGYGCGTIFSLDMGLGEFVTFVQAGGKIGNTAEILGQRFLATTAVSFNGVPAQFKVVSDTYLTATVPSGATTGYVTVTTPTGVLTSNVPFHVIP